MIDVIPFGDRQFLVRLFAVSAPSAVAAGSYHEVSCRIVLKDGRTSRLECVAHHPDSRRNVFGIHSVDHLVLLLQTSLPREELSAAAFEIARWGPELDEKEAKARLRPV